MSFTSAFFTLGFVFLLCVAVYAVFLKIGGGLAKIASASFFNALVAAFFSGLFAVVAWVVRLMLENRFSGRPVVEQWNVAMSPPILLVAIQVLLSLICAIIVVKIVLFTEWGPATTATIMMVVPGTIFAFLIMWVLASVKMDGVIPTTGMMAPTVINAHTTITCEACGWTYATRVPDWTAPQGKKAPEWYDTQCPNCGQPYKVTPDTRLQQGDRCLVTKRGEHQRWDVVYRVTSGTNEATQRVLTRVVGLPGESLELIGGDVFVGKTKTRLQKAPGEADDMWIPVNDSKYTPAEPVKGGSQWKAAGGRSNWKFADGVWSCVQETAGSDELFFSGKITDKIPYNLTAPSSTETDERLIPRPVGDVLIACSVHPLTGSGAMTITRDLAEQKIIAKINASGPVELSVMESGGAEQRANSTNGQMKSNLSVSAQVALAVRDGVAYVIDGTEVVAKLPLGPQDAEAAKERATRVTPESVCRISIGVSSGTLKLDRIKIFRDVYYRNAEEMGPAYFKLARAKALTRFTVGQDRYFLMGDNSPRSWDSRLAPEGVEADQVKATATSIYWPSSRWRGL